MCRIEMKRCRFGVQNGVLTCISRSLSQRNNMYFQSTVWYLVCGCHFIGIGLVLICHFPENDISSLGAYQSVTPKQNFVATSLLPHYEYA